LQLREAMNEVPALRDGKLIVADRAQLTPAGCFADASVVVPSVGDPSYVTRLLELCRELNVRAIVPLIDLDLVRLAPHLAAFQEIGTTVVSPSPELVELCLDKERFAQFALEEGLRAPRVVPAAQVADARFPLFAKRRRGFGSIGSTICRTARDAEAAVEHDPELIFQEFIDAVEISVDAYVSSEAKCIVRVPRIRDQVTGGEAQQSHTIGRTAVTELADRTIAALAGRGVRGPLNIQIFMSEQPLLIEVNTRLGSGSVLANQAVGGRLYAALLSEACGHQVSGDPDLYTEGLWMYRYFGDVFHDGKRAQRIIPDGHDG
jgi:carbamoyl-phosphate synthase large subunit